MIKFDDLLSKAQSVANVAGKKAGEIVEVSKLKLQAVQINNDIEETYERLGSLYYEQVKTGVDNEDLAAVCISEIDALLAALGDLNSKISSTQDLVCCPNCGANNPTDGTYCSRCGSSLGDEPVAYSRATVVEVENTEEITMEEESL